MRFRIDTNAFTQALKLVQPGITSSYRAAGPYVVVRADSGRVKLRRDDAKNT